MPNWYQQPFRIFQTNLREIDAVMDVNRVLDDLVSFHANAWLLNTAGIVSFYPTRLPYQTPSPWLAERASGDLLGDALEAAHSRGVRVISRFDWSKLPRRLFEAHPDWFFLNGEGKPQVYNDLYSACPSGPYNQELSFHVLGEVLDQYLIDGVFFNMFGFAPRDYSGTYHGICQCENCRRRFRDQFGRELPRAENWDDPAWIDYQTFTRETASELSARMRAFIHQKRPDVGLVLFMHAGKGDVVMHEVNNAINRPLPYWASNTGEKIKLSQGTYPGAPVTINSVLFLDIPYRFTSEQPAYIGLRLAQTLAHGANPYVYVIGTTQQADRRSHAVVRQWYDYHERNADDCAGLVSPARVVLVLPDRSERLHYAGKQPEAVTAAYRGFYQALTASHVQFDVIPDHALTDHLWEDGHLRYSLVVLPNSACLSDDECQSVDRYVAAGGRVIATHDSGLCDERGKRRVTPGLLSLGSSRVVERRMDMRSALLVIKRSDRRFLSGMEDSDILALLGEYLVVTPREGSQQSLQMIEPGRYGPPEKCYGAKETDLYGVIWYSYGEGRTAYLPWQPDRFYYSHALPEYRYLLGGLARAMAQEPLVLETNADPRVEIVIRDQPSTGRRMVHFVNYSGQNGRSFHDPLEMRDIRVLVSWRQALRSVRASVAGGELPFEVTPGGVTFTLPRLGLFEKVVFEP